MLEIKIKKLKPEMKIPNYAHPGDVGLDLYALEDALIPAGGHGRFYLGFALEFPEGYGAIVKDKGGLAKSNLHTMGGVFDAGFRGEYNVHLVNLGDAPYQVEKGDKVAQLVIFPIARATLIETDTLSDSSRGTGQFGSTGRK